MERVSATEFGWYRGPTAEELVKIAEISFDSDPGDLHVGVQSWKVTALFDNLAVIERSEADKCGNQDRRLRRIGRVQSDELRHESDKESDAFGV